VEVRGRFSVHPILRLLVKVTALPLVIPSEAEGPAVRAASEQRSGFLVLTQTRKGWESIPKMIQAP
jgi:hypothetical protein